MGQLFQEDRARECHKKRLAFRSASARPRFIPTCSPRASAASASLSAFAAASHPAVAARDFASRSTLSTSTLQPIFQEHQARTVVVEGLGTGLTRGGQSGVGPSGFGT